MNRIINKKLFLALSVIVFLIFGTLGVLRAVNLDYNRPHPAMDYVPQEIGVYDTTYGQLTESDCRGCHGNSLVDRHHGTATVVRDHQCTRCHEVTASGVSVIRDCTTSGCHSQYDLADNGWHHNTDLSGSGNCVACHNPNLIGEISPIRDFSMYPPSVVTPTPFSCENCHWEQAALVTGDPNAPGHPSTYDHYNAQGELVGFYEYGKSISSNVDTHHMGFQGNVATECYQCHAQDPFNPSWAPDNPQLIRYCEVCHSVDTLHRIGPHVQNTNGWEAAGFHVPFGNDNTEDLDPMRYRTWNTAGKYLPEAGPGFTADQQCFGCHGDDVPQAPPMTGCTPSIATDVAGIQPNHASCGAVISLRGECFGDRQGTGYSVQLYVEDEYGSGDWVDMPIYSWSDTLIEFEVPCWTILPKGNYKVRVVNPYGESNERVLTIQDYPPALGIEPDSGPCGVWIKIKGSEGGFGQAQSEIFDDGYHGVERIVDFVSSQGTYTALNYRNWNDENFEVRFGYFFKDVPETGQRNYIRDGEPIVSRKLAPGKWAVYVKAIYFGDDDADGLLSSGDTIFQVVTSDPLNFKLTEQAVLYRLTPTRLTGNNRVRIYGRNFGTFQDEGQVRIGSKQEALSEELGQGQLLDKVTRWSNTAIKVRVSAPPEWRGQIKYLWVEKDGVKTNSRRIKILRPLP